ncbi:MAG: hypothetical protein E7483_05850 [Ruminococcaceae bacterium]|nr:hypothetical protein [Oscillospiraceae bacterium]
MKKFLSVIVVMMFVFAVAGCSVNLTNQQQSSQYAQTEVITGIETEEKTNYVQKLELTQREEFYLNAFSDGNQNNAVFEIITEDYTGFEIKTYKFEDGQWKYTNNFVNGKIKAKQTVFAVEYYYLPDINFAYNTGSMGGKYLEDKYDIGFSYTSDTRVREWFEITEEETAFIAYRRLKNGAEGRLANTTDFANLAAVTDADENDEYYMITINLKK